MTHTTASSDLIKRLAIRAAAVVGAASLPAVAVVTATSAQADFTLCNKTSRNVDVTVGWIDPHGNGFTSQGWWTLRAGGHCETLVLDHETSDRHNYFFYAESIGDTFEWSGDVTLCTENRAFLISGPADPGWCRDVGFIARDFVHVHSPSGNHTTNLREPGGGGPIRDEGSGQPFDDNQ